MHKLRFRSALAFSTLLSVLLAASWALAVVLAGLLPLGDFHAICVVAFASLLFLGGAIASYRLVMHLLPLEPGNVGSDSRAVLAHELHVLFHILVFAPLARCGLLPAPLLRLFYLGLGARMGSNSYCVGVIHDPTLVEMGDNCLLGMNSQVVCHVLDGRRRAYFPVSMGNNVTVGPNAVVMPDVSMGDGAIIEAGAVVPRGSHVGAGEVWTGVPARPLTLADLVQRRSSQLVATSASGTNERAA